jgi:hypothetical protein
MVTKVVVKVVYGIFGALYLLAGTGVLLLKTDLLPSAVREIIDSVARNDSNTLHIMQEFGSLLVFVGLITFWFIRHYEQSWPFHWAMTAFWALFALVHWFDIRGPIDSVVGPLINSVPFALFALLGLLRLGTEARGKPG